MSIIVCDLNHTMLNYLSTKEIEKLNVLNIHKDETLFYEGDLCGAIYIVMKGQIQIESYTNDGKVIIFSTINENELFGHNLIFSNNKTYKGNVVATKDSILYEIKENEFLDILTTNKKFLKAYLNYEANNLKEFNNKIKILSIDSARERFLFYLKVNNNKINYLNITSLSKELGLTRETTSRIISKLVKEKVIINHDNTISLLNRTK